MVKSLHSSKDTIDNIFRYVKLRIKNCQLTTKPWSCKLGRPLRWNFAHLCRLTSSDLHLGPKSFRLSDLTHERSDNHIFNKKQHFANDHTEKCVKNKLQNKQGNSWSKLLLVVVFSTTWIKLKDTNTGSLLAKAQTLLIPQAVKACQNVKQLMFLSNLKSRAYRSSRSDNANRRFLLFFFSTTEQLPTFLHPEMASEAPLPSPWFVSQSLVQVQFPFLLLNPRGSHILRWTSAKKQKKSEGHRHTRIFNKLLPQVSVSNNLLCFLQNKSLQPILAQWSQHEYKTVWNNAKFFKDKILSREKIFSQKFNYWDVVHRVTGTDPRESIDFKRSTIQGNSS